jgi:biopolymer transport protein ExbD
VSFSPADPDAGGDAIVAEINVTPLTDLFLVLLVIFMVTSTAMMEQGSPVNLPRTQAGGSAPTGVIITATAGHQIQVAGKEVPIEQLGDALAEVFRTSGDRNVVLRGDRQVVLEDAVRIMTIAKGAGAEKIAIATQPDGGTGAGPR